MFMNLSMLSRAGVLMATSAAIAFGVSFAVLFGSRPIPAQAQGNASENVPTPSKGGDDPVSMPTGLLALSGHKKVYLEWDANPEFNLEGYFILRSDNGSAAVLITPELITETEFEDGTIEKDVMYTYQIVAQAGGVSSQPSLPSREVQGQRLKAFFPDISFSLDPDRPSVSLVLADIDGTGEKNWVRLPVSIESAYEVFLAAMDIVAMLPPDLVIAEQVGDVVVRRSGITAERGLLDITNVGRSILPDGRPGDLRYSAAGPEDGAFGSGTLFDIYVQPKDAEDACGNLVLVEDLFDGNPGSQLGVRFYDVEGAIAGGPLDVDLENGVLCLDNVGGCLLGEMDGDGDVDKDDAQRILDIFTRKEQPDSCSAISGDLNLDGRLNAADAALLLRWIRDQGSLNPEPRSLKSRESLQQVSYAALNAGANAEVSLEPESVSGQPGATIPVRVSIAGATAPLAGFNFSVAYLAGSTGLIYEGVEMGEGLSTSYIISGGADETGAQGSVKVSAGNPDELGEKGGGSVHLATLLFRIGGEAIPDNPIPVTLTEFASNDPFGHTPRHDAPGQALLTAKALVPTSLGVRMTDLDGDPIANAASPMITVEQLSLTVPFDAGREMAYLALFDPGTYTLKATADGFVDATLDQVRVKANQPNVFSVEMTPELKPRDGEGEGEGEKGGGCSATGIGMSSEGENNPLQGGGLLLLALVLVLLARSGICHADSHG